MLVYVVLLLAAQLPPCSCAKQFGQQRVPSAPAGVEVIQTNATSIRVSWKPPNQTHGELLGYNVYKDLLVNRQVVHRLQKAAVVADPNKHVVYIDDLEPNSEYAIRVAAFNSAGDGGYSASKRIITGGRPPSPPQPQTIAVQDGEGDSQRSLRARIEWLPPKKTYNSPITGYILWYKPKNLTTFERVEIPSSTSFVLGNLYSGQEYELHLAAVNSAGASANATEGFITPEGVPDGEPLNLRYTIYKKQLTVLWEPPLWFHRNGNITHYRIALKPSQAGGRTGQIIEKNVSVPMAVFDISSASESYNIKVAAATSRGLGPFSPTMSINTDKTSVGPPTNVRIQAISNSSVVVQWDFDDTTTEGAADGFVIKYIHEPEHHSTGDHHRNGLAGLERWRSQTVMDPGARHLELTRLLAQKPYAFCVLAIKHSRLGPCSDPPVLVEQLKPMFTVQNLLIQYKTSQSVAFQWEYASEGREIGFYIKQMGVKSYLDQYLEQRTLVPLPHEQKIDGSDRFFLWQNLRPYTNYTFQIGVYALEDGRLYWPKEVTVQTDTTGPPFVDAPEFIQANPTSPPSVQLKLYCASEEYGPMSHYWLIVVPTTFSKEDVINVESSQLQRSTDHYKQLKALQSNNSDTIHPANYLGKDAIGSEALHRRSRQVVQAPSSRRSLDGIYIAAQLASHRMQHLYRTDDVFLLGDGMEYDGYVNFPLDEAVHYRVMSRAFAKEDTWRSADNPFDYRPPMQEPANRLFTDSMLSEPFTTQSTPSSFFGGATGTGPRMMLVGPVIAGLIIFVIVGMLVVWRMRWGRKGGDSLRRPGLATTFRAGEPLSKLAFKSTEHNNGVIPTETSKLLLGMDSNGRPIVNSTQNAAYDDGPFVAANNVRTRDATGYEHDTTDYYYASSTLGRLKRREQEKSQQQLLPDDENEFAHMPASLSTTFSPIPLSDLATHIERLKMNNDALFIQEFESIETGHSFTWENSSLEVNKPKNRYANVVAYDHSRVILSMDERGTPGSDYINANYIDGYDRPRAYIATQGPLPETFADFWRMIWEERAATIVMLTNLEERSRQKCNQYWPTRGSSVYGNLRVHLLPAATELAHFCVRTLLLEDVRTRETREVKHCQFTAWPDHGVPNHPTPFLLFLKRVKSINPLEAGPIVTHCSAGVGRTGTFIVIDCMLDRLRCESTIDIYGCVRTIRTQRSYMVQTEDQYMFIYDAVLDAAQSGSTEVPSSRLQAHVMVLSHPQPQMGDLSGLQIEFQTLVTLSLSPAEASTISSLPQNQDKNRSLAVVPFDFNRVSLPARVGGDGSDGYINASWIDSYKARNAYIATAAPFLHTIDDFWRMLWSHECCIVVTLSRLYEGRESERLHEYWPNGRAENYGDLLVECVSEFDMGHYVLREFKLTHRESGKSRTLRQFHYVDWPEHMLPAESNFVEFIQQVHQTKTQFGSEGPICVHCCEGAGKTGVFVAISNLMEMIKQDRTVDVFTTVKQLRIQRPHMVESEEQYRFCYEAAVELVRAFDDFPS